eukprot:UN15998
MTDVVEKEKPQFHEDMLGFTPLPNEKNCVSHYLNWKNETDVAKKNAALLMLFKAHPFVKKKTTVEYNTIKNEDET